MQINPGILNKRISFLQEPSEDDTDKDGFPCGEQQQVYTCWAYVKNTSGKKIEDAGAEFAQAKKRFLIRWTDKVNEDLLILYRGNVYRILYINPYNDGKEYMEIYTERKWMP